MPDPCSRDEIYRTVSELVELGPRTTGTEGGRRAADYVEQRFVDAGLDEVWVEETSTYSWECTHHLLTLEDEEIPSGPIRHCALGSAEHVGEWSCDDLGEVVDIGDGSPRDHDVRGRVVLFDLTFTMPVAAVLPLVQYLHDPRRELVDTEVLRSRNPYLSNLTQVMAAAAQGGAVAVIGVLRDYPESSAYHNEYYRRSLLSLPGVWVTRAHGERLRRALAEGARSARVTLGVRRRAVEARTVLGVVRGRSDDTVMVQSHHDSIGPGAVEDATGTAAVIALAEHHARGPMRDKTMLFVTFDSHFTGYQAHMDFARRYVLDRSTPYRIVLNATIEHVGLRAVRAADGSFATTGTSEPRAIFENVGPHLKLALVRSIRRHGLHGTALVNALPMEFLRSGIPTDASFVISSGVPTISLVSGPLYLYDDADTLAMVDVNQLEPVVRAFVDVLERADRARSATIGLLPTPLRRLLPRGRW